MEHNLTLQGIPASETDANGPFHLDLTEAAVKMVKVMLEREKLGSEAGLRVSVSGGGCSGMQYGLTFDREQRADDVVLEKDGVKIFVDADSRTFLHGVTLDYVHALHGAGFKFINPKAERTCGCGSSFSV